MDQNSLDQRQKRYYLLSSALAQLDNAHLQGPTTTSEGQAGWGTTQSLKVAGLPIFVKRIPVTELEYAQMFSTQNVYDLPAFYQYGLGSVGFGVFRELVAHIKSTNWVLAGEIENFPLLYHYRIVPFTGESPAVDMAYHQRYVTYWGDNANVGRYLLDRAKAPYELILYLEHIPHVVATWVRTHPSLVPTVMADTQAALTFLSAHGIIHFDSHFFNLLTDGQRVYLTDFGLALDQQFNLSPAEMQFYKQHTAYDYGNLLWGLGTHIYGLYLELPEAGQQCLRDIFDIADGLTLEELLPLLLAHIGEIAKHKLISLEENYVASVIQYLPVITFMHDFYVAMRRNDQKDTPFNQTRLQQLLEETGFE
ncbi:MAG: hypothetical protein WAS33_28595 [Candidatus Promineifilaceae bacterium]|nr:hypothetical protein [Anaerolineaceae bacterium]